MNSAAQKTPKTYGPVGATITGRCKHTGRTWTATVGPSGKLIGKVFS